MKNSSIFIKNLESTINTAMIDQGLPGLALAIVKDDQVVFAGGFGVLEVGGKNLVDEHSIFATGSLTKAFTATAVGLLVQEGKISWDDAVVEYLPGFQMYDPYVTQSLTVRDLLCHRSGLGTWAGDLIWYGSTYSRDDILRRVRHIPPAYPFRAGYGYTNMMFLAAGQVIQTVSGQLWEDFVRERFFEPLGMSRTNTSTTDLAKAGNVAMPHQQTGRELQVVPYRTSQNMEPCGAINSSVYDLAQWLRLQLGMGVYDGQQLVETPIIEETHTPHTNIRLTAEQRQIMPERHFSSYGLGWFTYDYRGRLVIGHGGGIDGMLSYSGFLPEEQLGVVILTNKLPNSLVQSLFFEVVDSYMGTSGGNWIKKLQVISQKQEEKEAQAKEKFTAERQAEAPPSLPLERYTGDYTNTLYGESSVILEDNMLIVGLSAHPQVKGRLEHWHYDTFICRWSDPVWDKSMVPFITDGGGNVRQFSFKVLPDFLDPLEYIFEKKVSEK